MKTKTQKRLMVFAVTRLRERWEVRLGYSDGTERGVRCYTWGAVAGWPSRI